MRANAAVSIDIKDCAKGHRTRAAAGMMQSVVGRDARAKAKANEVERCLRVELFCACRTDVAQQGIETARMILVIQDGVPSPLTEGLSRVVPHQNLHARILSYNLFVVDLVRLACVKDIIAHHEVEERWGC